MAYKSEQEYANSVYDSMYEFAQREKAKMTDDNLDDVQKARSVGKLDSYDRAKVGFDRMDAHDKEIWNAAIEECLKIWDDIGPNETDEDIANRIRELKK